MYYYFLFEKRRMIPSSSYGICFYTVSVHGFFYGFGFFTVSVDGFFWCLKHDFHFHFRFRFHYFLFLSDNVMWLSEIKLIKKFFRYYYFPSCSVLFFAEFFPLNFSTIYCSYYYCYHHYYYIIVIIISLLFLLSVLESSVLYSNYRGHFSIVTFHYCH